MQVIPYTIARSSIHGYGVLAIKQIKAGEVVPDIYGSLRREPQWELFGGFNHSCSPNLILRRKDNLAIRDIQPGEELTVSYFGGRVMFVREGVRCNCPVCQRFSQCIMA